MNRQLHLINYKGCLQLNVSLTRPPLTLYVLNFAEGTKNIYLHLMSLLHIDMTHVLQILPPARQGST